MKCMTLVGLWVVCAVLTGMGYAASFTPVQESIYCNSDAETQHSGADPNHLTDRHDYWGTANCSTSSGTYLEVATNEYVQADSQSSMGFVISSDGTTFTDNKLQVTAGSESSVEITTDLGIKAFAWTGAETVAPGVATGNFYQIVAEEGELVGDWVTVTIDYAAVIQISSAGGSSNTALVHGPGQGDLLITLNCADYDDPQPSEIAHTFSLKNSDGSYAEQATFSAQIGDIIGIHVGAYTNAFTGTNPGSAQSSASADISMTLSPQFTPSMADFNGSGKVDLADFALFASAWLWEEPVNDTCENADPVVLDTHYTGTTVGMTDNSVWYSFTPTESGFYSAGICDGSGDYNMLMYDECGDVEPIAETDMDCYFAIWMEAGEDYLFEIMGYGEPEDDYDLYVTQDVEVPYNDDCGSAEEVYYDYAQGTTIGATGSALSICYADDVHDVWYTYTPQVSGDYVIVLHEESELPFAGVLTIYDGDSCSPLGTELDCQVFEDGSVAEIFINLSASTTYLVRVGSNHSGAGMFGLEFMYDGPM